MSDPRRISVRIGATTITNAFDVQGDIVANGVGSGSFSLFNTDAQIAVPEFGDLALILLDGTVQHRFYINNIERTAIAEGNEVEQITTFSGPHELSIMADSIVYPAAGVDTVPSGPLAGFKFTPHPFGDERYFAYLNADYTRTSWSAATSISTTTGANRPQGFPDTSAAWISSSSSTAVRTEYLHSTFNVSSTCLAVKLFAACRGQIVGVWINGTPVLSAGTIMNPTTDLATIAWESVFPITQYHTDNSIVVAVNHDTVSTPGFCAVLMEQGTTTVVSRTSTSWKAIASTSVPVLTWGYVLRKLIAESQARGDLSGVTTDFSDTVDTAGTSWADITDPTFSVRVGDTLEDILNQAAELGIEFAMKSTTTSTVLSAWVAGTAATGGRGSSTSACSYEVGVNCTRQNETVNG